MLLAGPISHTNSQCMHFVEVFNIHRICLLLLLPILVGVEIPLRIVVILSKNTITCFLE